MYHTSGRVFLFPDKNVLFTVITMIGHVVNVSNRFVFK